MAETVAVMQQTLELTLAERQALAPVVQATLIAQQRASDVGAGILAARGITGPHQMELSQDLKTMTIRPAPVAG